MTCSKRVNAIADVALGTPVPADLEAHLASCATCRARLEGERRLAALVDGELHTALAIEPSPDLALRARQRLREEAAAWRWPEPRWLLPLAAMLIAAAVLMLQARTPPPEVTTARLERPPSTVLRPAPEISLPRESAALSPAATVRSTPTPVATSARPPRRQADEVLVDPGERRALDHFIASLTSRAVMPGPLPAPPDGELAEVFIPSMDVASVELEPLHIEPLEGSHS